MNLVFALLTLPLSVDSLAAERVVALSPTAIVASMGDTEVAKDGADAVADKDGANDDATAKDDDATGNAQEDDDDDATGNAAVGDAEEDEEDETPGSDGKTLSGNVTLASDYILRGLSQTDNQPALQGGFDWNHPVGVNLGVWGSNVHFEDSEASLELDAYGGYAFQITDSLKATLGVLYYTYFESSGRNSWDFSVKTDWHTFNVGLNYSPMWMGLEGSVWYVSAGWSDQLIWELTFGVQAGYSFFSDDLDLDNYVDAKVSVSRKFLGVDWELSGILSNNQNLNGAVGGPRVVFAVSKSF